MFSLSVTDRLKLEEIVQILRDFRLLEVQEGSFMMITRIVMMYLTSMYPPYQMITMTSRVFMK